MSADVRMMKRSARLMAGYPRIGGSPDGGLSYILPEAMGYEKAMRFLLENRTVEGDEALALGLVGEVVDDDRFEARFHDYCQSLTQLSPITARLTKRDLQKATTAIDLDAFALQDSEHRPRLRQPRRPGSADGLHREAPAGVRGQVARP